MLWQHAVAVLCLAATTDANGLITMQGWLFGTHLYVLCMQEQGNQPVGTQKAKMPRLKAALREGIFDVMYECIQSAAQVVLVHDSLMTLSCYNSKIPNAGKHL